MVDHFTNTFSQYIEGGSDFATQTLVYEGALYRNLTVDDLQTMLFITSAGDINNVKGKDPIYFDNFYIDTEAQNLSAPELGGATAGTGRNKPTLILLPG